MLKTKTLLFFAVIGSLFLLKPIAKADLLRDYVANETQEVEQRRTVGSGSRSNCQSDILKNSISLLIPEPEVVHQTSVARPTLYLAANKISSKTPFKFTLVDPQSAKTLVEKDFSVSGGIERIVLPESTRLEYNKIYLWYVAIPCENNVDEYRGVLGAAIERRQPSMKVKSQLQQAENELETAAIYAQNGFWYDALDLAVRESNRSNYLERLLNSAEVSQKNN
jgi:hypothetical protein